ncbi:hypothetical protein CG08_0047 [Riemerella anatipestifer]|nr:hypothetical protein CG08_0047 [Riemerella anatipestifer]
MFLSLYGNNNDKELRDIFNSSKFVTLTKTFGIASKDINLDNFEKEKIDNDSSIYRFTVTRDNNKDYLTVIKMNNEATVFIFEKIILMKMKTDILNSMMRKVTSF